MKTRHLKLSTKGHGDIMNITAQLESLITEENIQDGILFISVIGSTAGLTTMEYESGLEKDVKEFFRHLIPPKEEYAHNLTWNDNNAHAHLCSSLLKAHLFVSVTAGKLDVGTWQQIVLIDFDIRKRERVIVVKILA